MSQIYDSLKALVSPDMVSRAASYLGEKDSKVSSAVSSIIPGFLASLLKRGDSSAVQSALEEAGRTNLLSDSAQFFNGNMSDKQKNIGDNFVRAVLGNKTSEFNNAIAADSGISSASASKLSYMIAPLVAGFLGNRLISNNSNLPSLINELNREKNSFMGAIPGKLSNALGLSAIKGNVKDECVEPKKKNNSWITWLIVILLLLLLFFWWRSCRRGDRVDNNRYATEYVDSTEYYNNRVPVADRDVDTKDIEFNDGTVIRVRKGSLEDKMLTWVDNHEKFDSDSRWFHVDNVAFEHGSSTQLVVNPNPQIQNLAKILKAFPNAKIEIAGYADKTGTDEENMRISEARANHIKSLLVADGLAANRISTEGFGEKKATVSEDASDRERAEDREFAIRFVK